MPTDVRIISDTHGLLRPRAETALEGADLILHAGDVGRDGILQALESIAPTVAVRGNVDHSDWAESLPLTQKVCVEGVEIYLIHDRDDLIQHPPPSKCAAVIFGHSHKPLIEKCDGMVYINPGSAGPRRFSLPVSTARLHVDQSQLQAEIVELQVG